MLSGASPFAGADGPAGAGRASDRQLVVTQSDGPSSHSDGHSAAEVAEVGGRPAESGSLQRRTCRLHGSRGAGKAAGRAGKLARRRRRSTRGALCRWWVARGWPGAHAAGRTMRPSTGAQYIGKHERRTRRAPRKNCNISAAYTGESRFHMLPTGRPRAASINRAASVAATSRAAPSRAEPGRVEPSPVPAALQRQRTGLACRWRRVASRRSVGERAAGGRAGRRVAMG